MTGERFKDLVRELLDENPFAIRPFLKVAGIRFTDEVTTMAVTCTSAPELLVNLAFVSEHCHGDAEVKAVLLHEFLHVLLRHTEGRGPVSPAEHLATDAVINAIIHRQGGCGASSMMSQYYASMEGIIRILRPPKKGELPSNAERMTTFEKAWDALYRGTLVVDDILELAQTMSGGGKGRVGIHAIHLDILLGNHSELCEAIPEALAAVLRRAMRAMNGSGIWRSAKERGIGTASYSAGVQGAPPALRAWEMTVLALLRKHLMPDRHSRAQVQAQASSVLPVLGPQDRRAFARALWSPILPIAAWELTASHPAGTAQVYLDVSGSMNSEMPLIIGLLGRVRSFIRMPFWAFSDLVKPARIVKGQLLTETSGGTSLTCVLDHVARTRPESAIIVTDGYIERVDPHIVAATRPCRIHAIVTRGGSTAELERARIPYTQLQEVPR